MTTDSPEYTTATCPHCGAELVLHAGTRRALCPTALEHTIPAIPWGEYGQTLIRLRHTDGVSEIFRVAHVLEPSHSLPPAKKEPDLHAAWRKKYAQCWQTREYIKPDGTVVRETGFCQIEYERIRFSKREMNRRRKKHDRDSRERLQRERAAHANR